MSLAATPFARKPRAAIDAPPAGEDIGQLQITDPPRALPPIHFLDDSGVRHDFSSFAGQGVILNFWATWCGPCVAEMPSLAALAPRVAPDRIVVLPLSADSGGADAVRHFYRTHAITGLPVLLDPDQAAASAIGAFGLPTTLILNRRGREVARIAGGTNWALPGTIDTLRALVAIG